MGKTKIKICGLRRPEDIDIINSCLPDYAGFICCSRFWRYVPRESLRELSAKTDRRIRRVGVFVDDPVEIVSSYIKEGLIDIVQLHGNEDEDYIRRLRELAEKTPVIKAFRIREQADMDRALMCSADMVLLDGGQGQGKTFDWKLVRSWGRKFFLAGGLGPDNLKQAVSALHPYAVDMSSGVETDRCKDADKVRRAVEIVRQLP